MKCTRRYKIKSHFFVGSGKIVGIERFIQSKKVFYSVYPKPFGFPPTRATHAYIGYESYSLLRRAHFILQRVQILPIFDSILI